MKNLLCLLLIISFAISQGEGGENVDIIGYLEFGQNTSDITGFYQDGREFVAIGLQNGSAIVDVTNPNNPFEIARISGGTSIWRDLKYWNRHVYIGTEANDGIQIVSVDNPDNPILVNTINDFGNSHNVHIDSDGFLYVVGASGCDIWIYDLSDPSNPLQEGCWIGEYIHDLEVFNNKAYACGIYSGVFYIVDLEDKSNPSTIISYQTDSGGSYSTHDAAVTFDENYLIIGDESPGAIVSIYDISDYSNINKISEYYTDGYSGNGYLLRSAHNVYVQESTGLLITSFYIDGTRIVDISDPFNPVEVGYYDTSEGDLASQGDPYYGNWGTYVDLPSGNIVSSDIENGLFILSYNYAPAELLYSPDSFEFEMNLDTETTSSFVIQNIGEPESILSYNLNVSPFETPSSGPDTNDNYWADSDNESSLSYDWIDISDIGTEYSFLNNDDAGSTIDIGFNFEFYGQEYSQCIINPNGWVGFGSDSNSWENTAIPSNQINGGAIFALWDDLNPVNEQCNQYCSGNVYYHSSPEKFVIWFDQVAHWWTYFENAFYDFQIIIYPSGKIDLNYRNLDGDYDASVGIQKNSSIGTQVIYGVDELSNNLNITFESAPEWLSINPNEGTLIDGETASISITCNSGDYNDGNYNAFVNIASNGGSVSLPVEMMINGSLLGDTNGDSTINVLDVIIMVNMVLGETEADLNTADINGDDLINVSDVVLLINMILG